MYQTVVLLPLHYKKVYKTVNIMFMAEVAGLTVQLTMSPEGELLMCINAEPGGRGINARLTQNRFHLNVIQQRPKTISHKFLNIITVKLCPQYCMRGTHSV